MWGWKILLDMTAQSVSLFMQEVIDKTGCESVKLIHDNGSQLISKEFRDVLTAGKVQQVRIRRNHPQSNGKSERFNGLVRQECLRPESPATITEVEKIVGAYIDNYNIHRLHSSLAYMRPVDYYMGNPRAICAERIEKLKRARKLRMAENRTFNQALKTQQTTAYFEGAACSV